MKILKNKWLWLVLIVLVGGAIFFLNADKPAETVQVYQVDSGAVDAYVEDDAVVKSTDDKVHYAELSGVIAELAVAVGDSVKKGAVLAKFDSAELEFALAELTAKKEGGLASRAEIVTPDNDELVAQMSSAVRKAQSNVANISRQLKNQRLLYQSGAASLESVNQLSAMLTGAQSDLSAAQAARDQAQNGGSDNVVAQADSGLAQIDVQIDRLNNQLAKSTVEATIDGVVVAKMVSEGQFVPIGTPLLTVEAPTKLELEARLLAEDIVDLAAGSAVEVLRDDKVVANGTVSQIYPKAESTISDLGVEQKRVKVLIDIAEGDLKLGYEYNIKVYVKREQHLRIPDSAYFEIDGQGKVFVVEDQKLKLRDITVVFEGNDYYAVEGLKEGEKIVRSPSSRLEVDMKVAEE